MNKKQYICTKLGIGRHWQGIYNESQRHYLDGKYQEEVIIEQQQYEQQSLIRIKKTICS